MILATVRNGMYMYCMSLVTWRHFSIFNNELLCDNSILHFPFFFRMSLNTHFKSDDWFPSQVSGNTATQWLRASYAARLLCWKWMKSFFQQFWNVSHGWVQSTCARATVSSHTHKYHCSVHICWRIYFVFGCVSGMQTVNMYFVCLLLIRRNKKTKFLSSACVAKDVILLKRPVVSWTEQCTCSMWLALVIALTLTLIGDLRLILSAIQCITNASSVQRCFFHSAFQRNLILS